MITAERETALPAFDVAAIREQFPVLTRHIHGKPLVYLDSGATTLKPRAVVERISQHYLYETSNVHRGIHTLSGEATTMFENARETVRAFLNAARSEEIIFTHGTTDAINLVAHGLATTFEAGDEIVISELDHHSNIVPWHMVAKTFGLIVKAVRIDDQGELSLDAVKAVVTDRTRVIAFTSTSNTLGTITPYAEICAYARSKNILTLIDAAQSVAHQKLDVQKIKCDFLVFSAHKIYGPTGIGCLYGRFDLLKRLPPVSGGGGMIKKVTLEDTTYDEPPQRFEAGTPHIAGAIGLAAAIDWIQRVGLEVIYKHEHDVLNYAIAELKKIEGLRLVGFPKNRGPILSFVLDSAHPHDVGTLLDEEGVAVRTGHHCTQPIMDKFKISATVRASFGVYNSREDVDRFVSALAKVKRVLS